MKKQPIKICAPPPEELRDGFTKVFAKVYFDSYLKQYTYEQIDAALKQCEGVLQQQKSEASL